MEERKGPELQSLLPTGVFELPGEPVVVINGVPDICPPDGTIVLSSAVSEAGGSDGNEGAAGSDFFGNLDFGEWLEGREVHKLFGQQYFRGTVTQFDKETGWYRVVYEDGDFEDLDWSELEAILLPLDVSVPLKTLALKIAKRGHKTIHKSGKTATRSRATKAMCSRHK